MSMSHYTFTFLPEVYRWMVAEQLVSNLGQLNDKALVALPPETSPSFENGWVVAKAVKTILAKAGQQPSPHLAGLLDEETRPVKVANWNFIWLCFEELRLQFDNRIRELILQGEHSLIPEILKQLYERDEHRDEKEMRLVQINEKPAVKAQSSPKAHTLDVKRINLQKDPADSESSLEYLILLLAASFSMPVEEILGLFTNQNKYLAHLLVKGINDNYEGVVLFYSLLLKTKQKFREYIETDPRDAESLLYAVKPGLISKSPKVVELSLQLFRGLPKVYDWLVSDTGRGSATIFLGIKRHPHLAEPFAELLLEIIRNQEKDFFTNHLQAAFRDPLEMVQICALLLPTLAGSFLKPELQQLGIFNEWASIALSLAQEDLGCKIVYFKFAGALMAHLPDLVQQKEEYLSGIRRGWRECSMVEFMLLMEELLLILEELASEKRPMARRVYQILLEVMESVFENEEKREILVRGFTSLIARFPKIPAQHLISAYRGGSLSSADLELVLTALQHAPDQASVGSIAEVLMKLFSTKTVLNSFLGPILFKICRRGFAEEAGRVLTVRVIRECLGQYVQLEGVKKVPEVARKQPMYFVQKGNQKYSSEEEEEFIVAEKTSKNLLLLIEKCTDLLLSARSEALTQAAKQEFLEGNAVIKKSHYKANNRAISNILAKKFGVGREEEEEYNEDYRVKKSLAVMEESNAKRRMASSSAAMTSSRYACPDHLRKDFDDVVQKRKKEEEERRLGGEKKQRDDALKKIMVRKELEKTNLLRGFGQEAELKEEGFWSKLIKERGELELYPRQFLEGRDLEYIENLFRKYHKVLRNLFFKYTCSKYTVKSHANVNFEDNRERNETLNVVEVIQFLKDYKLFFLTSKEEIQSLVRDLNVKMLHKRETQELDFLGFEQFVLQFCVLVYTKTHTINANTSRGVESIKKNLGHLSHLQLVEEWFNYLKLVFIEKGDKTMIFDEPEAAYFNQTEVVKEFARKLEDDPTFILPEGYKKVTEKTLRLNARLSDKNTRISQAYKDVYEVLDQILYESDLRIHILEPLMEKEAKVRVKPHVFMNIKTKLLDNTDHKVRALSSILDKKSAIPPVKMLERKILSLGMKLGLAEVAYKDKMLGEQVAYVIDDMLSAVEAGRSNIDKDKITNDYQKKQQEMADKGRFAVMDREKKRLERKNQLEKMKKDFTEKKEKDLVDTKDERDRKQQKKQSREKKVRDDKDKYKTDQKKKIEDKKKEEQQQEAQKKGEPRKKHDERKKKEAEFNSFNEKQIEKFKKEFDGENDKKKKEQDRGEAERKKKQELVRKLRTKIHDSDKKAIEAKHKMLEEISELYGSVGMKRVFADFDLSIRAVFEFLLKSSFLPVTLKKNNSEVIVEAWHYFGLVFQLNPFIISAKELTKIFRNFTKDKQTHKDYSMGLTYEEFKQALLRIAIRHKSVFNKLAEKIREDMSPGEIEAVVQKDIEDKEKNEFEEPKQLDVKTLLKEEDISNSITDHYGDISKANDRTLKGLVYYLKVPRDKLGQETRFRELLSSKISYAATNIEQLRGKLNDEYSLQPPVKPTRTGQSQLLNSSLEPAREKSPEPKLE